MTTVTEKQIASFMAGRKRSQNHISRKYPKFSPGMSTADYIEAFRQNNKPRFDKQSAEVLPYNLAEYLHTCTINDGPEVIEESI